MNSVLEFNDIARSYTKGVPVLDGVSFSVDQGEVLGLLGRNGTGKTTLIRIAMGMLFPHRGSARVFGLSPTEDPVAIKQRIGYVAEDQVLPAGSTIAELMDFHRYLFSKWDAGMAGQTLDRFGLSQRAKIKSLSKGQARQVALLCAVCHRPELLVLDEPGAGLDPAARREFLEISIQLLNREGTTILFSSHYMNDVERIGGRVVLLDRGRVLLDSNLDRLREDFCVALVPKNSSPTAELLERIPGCLRAHLVHDSWHTVFEGPPNTVEQRLVKTLGANGVRCLPVPLEELFVELVGDQRTGGR